MWDWSVRGFLVGLMMLAIAGCASTNKDGTVEWTAFGQEIADQLVTVSPELRDLRICLIAAGAVEVMTDLAQRGGNAQLALGNLTLLQNAIDKARRMDSLWVETDAADVSLLFAKVLKDAGKSRLSQILLRGPTIHNFVGIANRAVVLTVKGRAVIKDINSMLRAVHFKELEKAEAWRACENRLAMNRTVLQILNGGHVSSTETFIEGHVASTETMLGGETAGGSDEIYWPPGSTSFVGIKPGTIDGMGLWGTQTVELGFLYRQSFGPFDWKPIYGTDRGPAPAYIPTFKHVSGRPIAYTGEFIIEGWGGLTAVVAGRNDEGVATERGGIKSGGEEGPHGRPIAIDGGTETVIEDSII